VKPIVRGAISLILILPAIAPAGSAYSQQPSRTSPTRPLEALKQEAAAGVERQRTLVQQIIDQLFSYGELAFQEIETSRYLTSLHRKNGFTVTEGVAAIPTAWWRAGEVAGLPGARHRLPTSPGGGSARPPV
jgi:aminobenzoyl-glutamate utilization protein B